MDCPYQVIHLPPVQPEVWELQLLAGWCGRCAKWTRAKLPDGVPTGLFGPSVLATVGVLMGALRLCFSWPSFLGPPQSTAPWSAWGCPSPDGARAEGRPTSCAHRRLALRLLSGRPNDPELQAL
jgi:hypothetical protein